MRLQPRLADHLRGDCSSCCRPLQGAGKVDHVISRARYSFDLGFDVVLAPAPCTLSRLSPWQPFPI